MSQRVKLCAVADLPEGEIRGETLPDGTRIALYKVGGTIYATADKCTHGEVSLSEEGTLDGCTVECSWHFGTFDITTGKATGMPCEVALKTYPVEVIEGNVHVVV
ncbi:non-heme iron oxygenase ferredoxin subunit [Zavarzinia compransoris]|uniref:Ferredoxin n=1 Tax=Zavarzinia compransoris TaxID=1264899 RepID=A0A317E6E1_9PROT|nr:non-heme iron oxygenase ferredoxin subunit [Zavarzinia compransoris]PWR20963.1 ferredoxin [Zavarzinia compransoris]TDP43991.1 p-cumate 2,3-dioxygenase ferredoxin subunit [Zavarzinia compransoris]